jgi:hypothetical protein
MRNIEDLQVKAFQSRTIITALANKCGGNHLKIGQSRLVDEIFEK